MSYEAIVCHIKTRPHPNADRVQLGVVNGYQVVVGLDTEDGELGVFFPADGQLSHEFCMANSLYRKHPDTGEEMGGYFDANRRVRSQKFRGCISEGYWVRLDELSWTGAQLDLLKAGDTFSVLNDKLVAEKYETPATKKAKQKALAENKPTFSAPLMKKHFSTNHLRRNAHKVPDGAVIYVTEKLHGTSGRTGYLPVKRSPRSKIKRWINKFLGRRLFSHTTEYEKITGSRNVVFDPLTSPPEHYRVKCVQDLRLHKGETIYYEIVGFTNKGGPIMGQHALKKARKEIGKDFPFEGRKMTYNYGCQRSDEQPFQIYVYRITHTSEEGVVTELSWPQVVARCRSLGINHVPEVDRVLVRNKSDLKKVMKKWNRTWCQSTLDEETLMEGVCFRVEHEEMHTIFKLKHFAFKVCEGIAKADANYVDTEEAA